MFSVCVPPWIDCFQGLYIQSQVFQVLYIQSRPTFLKLFCFDRFLWRFLCIGRNKENQLNRVLITNNDRLRIIPVRYALFTGLYTDRLGCGRFYLNLHPRISLFHAVFAWILHCSAFSLKSCLGPPVPARAQLVLHCTCNSAIVGVRGQVLSAC